MTEQEQFILDGVLRDEPFICVHGGYAYFLGPEAPTKLNWQDAMTWCKSLGDDYELPSKEILIECYENESIRKEFFNHNWYWSSTMYEKYKNHAGHHHSRIGVQYGSDTPNTHYVRAVRKIKI